jgi:hypothetical protein
MELDLTDEQQRLLDTKIQVAQSKAKEAQEAQKKAQEAQAEAQQAQERALGLMEAWTAAEGLDVDVEELEYEQGVLTDDSAESSE